MHRRWILGLGLVVAACSDGGVGSRCHDHDDCDRDLGCLGPNDWPGCGIPAREQCVDDTQCPFDRCHAVPDPCSRDGIGSECRSACSSDGNCGAGFRCDAGACVAILCNAGAGVTCAAREVCDPSRITAATPMYDRTSGCYPVTCDSDDACGDRVCVNGMCQDSIGFCRVPEIRP